MDTHTHMFWQQNFSHKLEDSLGFLAHFLTPHIGTWPLILPSPPQHLLFCFNFVHAVPDELRTLCSGIKRVPTLQNTCYLLQASIWKQSHKSNYFPWKSRTPQVHQLPFYSSSRTLHTAQFCSQPGYASQLSNVVPGALQACQRRQQLTHLKNNAHFLNLNLTKHQPSHNSVSFSVAFQCSNHHLQLAILGKTTSFCLQSFFCL
jgi:hypothetical protein